MKKNVTFRIISLLMAVILVLGLSACGQQTPADNENGEAASGQAVVAPSTDGKRTEIEYWYCLGGTLGEAVEKIIADFNTSQNRIFVKGVQLADFREAGQVFQAAIAAQDVPAAVMLNDGIFNTFMEKGALLCLDDLITKDPDIHFDDFLPSLQEFSKDASGKVYGMPAFCSTHIVFYNIDIFEKAQLNPQETLKSYQSIAEASEKLASGQTGAGSVFGFDPMYDTNHFMDIAKSAGGEVLSEDKKTATINAEPWIETWDAIRKWINEDHIMNINYGGEGWEFWYKTVDDVMQGRTAAYIGSTADIPDLDFSIVAPAMVPCWEDNAPVGFFACIQNIIPAGATPEEQAAAYEWIKYFASTEANAQFSMASGYVPVRESCRESANFKSYLESCPAMGIALEQVSKYGEAKFIDFAGDKVNKAIQDAFDLVIIENMSAQEALNRTQPEAQAALDGYWETH